MSIQEFAATTALIFIMLPAANVGGILFVRLRQPRVIGELLAGVLTASVVASNVFDVFSGRIFGEPRNALSTNVALSYLYHLGLVLLMFFSGAEAKGLLHRDDRRDVAWLGLIGTGLPFVLALLVVPLLDLDAVMGPAHHRISLVLVLGIAIAVTSIPVISRILYDLRILNTRFARLVLAVAVLEDIALWAVLAVATALAKSGASPQAQGIILHVAVTIAYLSFGLLVLPWLLRTLTRARWNVLVQGNPLSYLFSIILGCVAAAALLDVSLVFAAFLAGLAVADSEELAESIAALEKISFAVLIPIYFAVVGYRLDIGTSFSLSMLAIFLFAASLVKLMSLGLAARLAGFDWLSSINVSVALNARGGPGIVLASVALDAGIINRTFYTTLVLVAVFTSQIAGTWLAFVLRRGWNLLSVTGADGAKVKGGVGSEAADAGMVATVANQANAALGEHPTKG